MCCCWNVIKINWKGEKRCMNMVNSYMHRYRKNHQRNNKIDFLRDNAGKTQEAYKQSLEKWCSSVKNNKERWRIDWNFILVLVQFCKHTKITCYSYWEWTKIENHDCKWMMSAWSKLTRAHKQLTSVLNVYAAKSTAILKCTQQCSLYRISA